MRILGKKRKGKEDDIKLVNVKLVANVNLKV